MAVNFAYATTCATAMPTHSGSSPVITPSGQAVTIHWNVQGDMTASTHPCYRPGTAYTFGDLEHAWYDGAACSLEHANKLKPGQTYPLPDGGRVVLDAAGNYRVEDADAKVTYRANRNRDFSPHLNASDLLARFVEYVGTLGVRQSEVLGLPIELFVNWLVVEAAERDHDPVPAEVVPVARHPALLAARRPRCLRCQRYIPRGHARRFPFCTPDHAARYLNRAKAITAG